MLQKNRFKILYISIVPLFLLTILLYIILDNNWFYSLIESVLAPLFIVCLTLLASQIYLLFFNLAIQQLWWRWARFALLVPFALIILLLPTYEGGGGFVTLGGTTDGVILWGVVFVAATLVTTLYHRFYRKTGVPG